MTAPLIGTRLVATPLVGAHLVAAVSITSVAHWFNDPDHWNGANGVPHRLGEHIQLSLAALVVACLVAIPIGVVLGHVGRGGLVAQNVANLGRAVPSLAILVIAVPIVGIGPKPAYLALTALALPPILTNTYVGMRQVDPEVREAARGMGMTSRQMITGVELPLALPLVLAGVRTSAFQVIATATLAAEVAAGGLGRYIVDGMAIRDDTQVVCGALLVVALALVVEGAIAGLQRTLIPSPLRNPTRSTDDSLLEETDHEILDQAA
jgi:osmoprotectant transport system permease protein